MQPLLVATEAFTLHRYVSNPCINLQLKLRIPRMLYSIVYHFVQCFVRFLLKHGST